jgi:hypothetical protein
LWTSPQPPASSCAQERGGSFPCRATRKQNLEDAAMVKWPILQADGLTKPVSWKNEFRNTISFLRSFLIYYFRYLSVVIYTLSPSNNPISFRSCHETNVTIYLIIYLLDSYESAWLSLVKIHGFSKIKTTWPIRLKTMSFAAQLHNLMKYGKGGFASDSRLKSF